MPNIGAIGTTADAWRNNSVLGAGGPLRSAHNDLSARIHGASDADADAIGISYEFRLHAWHGCWYRKRRWRDKDLANDNVYFDAPDFYQTPVIEDVTITYLGPVVFYHWR